MLPSSREVLKVASSAKGGNGDQAAEGIGPIEAGGGTEYDFHLLNLLQRQIVAQGKVAVIKVLLADAVDQQDKLVVIALQQAAGPDGLVALAVLVELNAGDKLQQIFQPPHTKALKVAGIEAVDCAGRLAGQGGQQVGGCKYVHFHQLFKAHLGQISIVSGAGQRGSQRQA